MQMTNIVKNKYVNSRLCEYEKKNYHLKQPPSMTSSVKLMDNLSKIGSKTRG